MATTGAKLLSPLSAANLSSRPSLGVQNNELATKTMCLRFPSRVENKQFQAIMAEDCTVGLSSSTVKRSLLKQSRRGVVCAVAETAVAGPSIIGTQAESAPMQLTYLEGNSWLCEVGGVRFLVDPIIGSPLDFNIPWLYSAYKFVTRDMTVDTIPEVDYLLITQSLDDHCHLNTLRPLAERRPTLPVISTPNAEPLLKGLFKNVTYLEPGESTTVTGANGVAVSVKATKGPVLGPPWQRPENGYILRSSSPEASLYLEPHCVFTEDLAKEAPVQVVVTPVVKQELPALTLVSGQEDALRLAKLLKAKYVVPMANAELDAKGLLTMLVKASGTVPEFLAMLEKELPETRFLNPVPNQPLSIPPTK